MENGFDILNRMASFCVYPGIFITPSDLTVAKFKNSWFLQHSLHIMMTCLWTDDTALSVWRLG